MPELMVLHSNSKSFKQEKYDTCSLLFTTGGKFRNTTTYTEVVKTNNVLPQLVKQYSNYMQTRLLIIQE